MNAVLYGISRARVTLYASDGVTPTRRITLQKEDREGLSLGFKPEGHLSGLGSGAGWARKWNHRGFRPQLLAKWGVGIDPAHGMAAPHVSEEEVWNVSTSQWGTAQQINTALALAKILNTGFQTPCLVEPHLDSGFSFLAQPDPDKLFALQDLKAVAHSRLELSLLGTTLMDALPDWATTWVVPDWIDPGYTEMGTLAP